MTHKAVLIGGMLLCSRAEYTGLGWSSEQPRAKGAGDHRAYEQSYSRESSGDWTDRLYPCKPN